MEQLSLSARPRTLDGLVGQQRVAAAIRGHIKAGRTIKSWLFTGKKGTGKTSIARILALSFMCTHQEKFGRPCKDCYRNRAKFGITEVSAAEMTKAEFKTTFASSDYGPMGAGRYRIYILDEAHDMTKGAQELALKYTEDAPESSIFILCSTAPSYILETLRSRCTCYEMKELGPEDIEKLVDRLLKKVESGLPTDRLSEALVERDIRSPRLIAMAVEKYVSGSDPEEAVIVEGVATIDTRALTRAVVKGDWQAVSRQLMAHEVVDARAIRSNVLRYLRVTLLESPEMDKRTESVAFAITDLTSTVQYTEDIVTSAAIAASLYRMTQTFSEWKR